MLFAGAWPPTIDQSLGALIGGTTAEEEALGLATGFDVLDGVDQVDVHVAVNVEGAAQIDFLVGDERWFPGPMTSAQHSAFFDPLLATVFHFGQINELERSTLCWGESDCEGTTTRAEWEANLFASEGILFHGDCDAEQAQWFPDRCTVEGILKLPKQSEAVNVGNVQDGDVLRLRAGPGAQYPEIGSIEPGATVVLTYEAAKADDSGIWRPIDTKQWGAGWVNAAFLEIPRTEEEALADAFVAFARNPSNEAFTALPLSEYVNLGLGPELMTTLPAEALRQPSAWVIQAEMFRAYVGPLSALNGLSALIDYNVVVGEHPHCASPPVPAPVGMESLTRVSVQPRPRHPEQLYKLVHGRPLRDV